LLRILLVGYLYGISSERKLVEELRMHLAWRWFTGLGSDQEIPHHSTFSKNRHRRFQESKLFANTVARWHIPELAWADSSRHLRTRGAGAEQQVVLLHMGVVGHRVPVRSARIAQGASERVHSPSPH
jgi:hypothetical protein